MDVIAEFDLSHGVGHYHDPARQSTDGMQHFSGFSPARLALRCRSASCPGSRASPICLPVRRGRTSSSWSPASSWRRVDALSRRHCASWGAI